MGSQSDGAMGSQEKVRGLWGLSGTHGTQRHRELKYTATSSWPFRSPYIMTKSAPEKNHPMEININIRIRRTTYPLKVPFMWKWNTLLIYTAINPFNVVMPLLFTFYTNRLSKGRIRLVLLSKWIVILMRPTSYSWRKYQEKAEFWRPLWTKLQPNCFTWTVSTSHNERFS